MKVIIDFQSSHFQPDGINIIDGKTIFDLQKEWETMFHNQFSPYFANVIEAHSTAMERLTLYYENGIETNYDFGIKLSKEKDKGLTAEQFSKKEIVYALGSKLKENDDSPLFLIKNDDLAPEVVVFKYICIGDKQESCKHPYKVCSGV